MLVEAATAPARRPFPKRSRPAARRALEKLGVEVRLGNAGDRSATTAASTLADGADGSSARTVLWAAGVAASPRREMARAPRRTAPAASSSAPDLTVAGPSRDLRHRRHRAALEGADGRPLPGVAPAAKQMGAMSARLIAARLAGRKAAGPFRYRDYGNLATIGRKAAVADFGRLRLSRLPRLAALGLAHMLVPDRLPQPLRRAARLGLGLCHLPSRRAPDHRRGG